jgi:hypothetical protein
MQDKEKVKEKAEKAKEAQGVDGKSESKKDGK